ncbi:MAG: SMP-30/gluconolactonase/LRE family protein [Tepidisphaeraceae bacterium]
MPLSIKRASIFADGLDHPECVAAHPDGSFFAGGEGGQIYRISRDGKRVETIANTGGFVLGVAISPDGNWLAACDLRKRCIWRLDLASAKLSELSRGPAKAPFGIPNHLAFTPRGELYVTDSGAFRQVTGRIIRLDVNGHAQVWHAGPFNFANGIAFSPAWDALFVVCTWLPGVERIELRPDGSAGKRSVFAKFPRTCPDGLAFDAKGNLYVTCYAPARIYRVTKRRKKSVLLDDWEAHALSNPTNIAFGGSRFDQLFAANLGRWHITRIDLKVRGAPLACHVKQAKANP